MTRNTRIAIIASLTAILLLVAFIPGSSAHNRNFGTIKVHDEPGGGNDNNPHVPCKFYVQGFEMLDKEGYLQFELWAPSGSGIVVPTGDDLEWTGTPGDRGYDFEKGPYSLPAGHYRVEAWSSNPNDDHDHFSKTKTFWVDGCDEPPRDFNCPDGNAIVATPLGNGSINVQVHHGSAMDGSTLYRSENGGPLTYLSTLYAPGPSDYLDYNTTNGATYYYEARVFDDGQEDKVCGEAKVTAVPVFDGIIVSGLAIASGLLGYALMRKR